MVHIKIKIEFLSFPFLVQRVPSDPSLPRSSIIIPREKTRVRSLINNAQRKNCGGHHSLYLLSSALFNRKNIFLRIFEQVSRLEHLLHINLIIFCKRSEVIEKLFMHTMYILNGNMISYKYVVYVQDFTSIFIYVPIVFLSENKN